MVVFIDRKIARGIRVEINFNIFFNYSLDFDVENVILYEMLIINFRFLAILFRCEDRMRSAATKLTIKLGPCTSSSGKETRFDGYHSSPPSFHRRYS